MIYLVEPDGFNPCFEVVSCFVEYNGEILLLHRLDHKPEGDTWGVPAGKVDQGETLVAAIVREIFQETGINISPEDLVQPRKIYVRYPEYDFVFYIFGYFLGDRPLVQINEDEHKDYSWKTPEEALELKLVPDEDACIKLIYMI